MGNSREEILQFNWQKHFGQNHRIILSQMVLSNSFDPHHFVK